MKKAAAFIVILAVILSLGMVVYADTLDSTILEFFVAAAEGEIAKPEFSMVIPAVQEMLLQRVAQAKAVLARAAQNDPSLTQSDLDAAAQRLLDAMTYLSFYKGDKTALIELAQQCAALREADYISGWAEFAAVLGAAHAVIADENALQHEVDVTYEALLNAFWALVARPAAFRVQFNSMGGGPVAPIVDVAKGSLIIRPADPIYAGYDFLGWYIDPEYQNEWLFDMSTVHSDLTLYARWGAAAAQISEPVK